MATVVLELAVKKQTKGTTVFAAEDAGAVVSPLYVNKPAFETAKKIRVTIEEVE